MSKAYVVTGASSGIGAAVAKALIARGDEVLAVARREEILRSSYGEGYLALDLCADEAVEAVAKAAGTRFGAIDGFVHCAGFALPMPLGLIDADSAKRLYAVHALFPMRFLGWMAKAANHRAGASAVLVGSRSTREADVGNVAYVAAKGAVEAMVRSAAAELSARGVRVNAVSPGIVDTEMARTTWMRTMDENRRAELIARHGGLATSASVAAAIVKLLDGEDNGRIVELQAETGK